MQTTTMGLVLKEVKVGEADRILTILTSRFGMIKASARGARNLRNKLFASTGMFCYSEFVLFTQKGNYYIDDATVHENFFGLRDSVEGLAVAAYIAELTVTLEPHRTEEIQELLRLALNSLFLLSTQKADYRQVKAVFELRAVSETGYRPDLLCCNDCGIFEDKNGFWFDRDNGRLFCTRCCEQHCHDVDLPLSVITAMRHTIYSEPKRIFSFSLAEESLRLFGQATEEYLLRQLGKPLKSLDFIHSLSGELSEEGAL